MGFKNIDQWEWEEYNRAISNQKFKILKKPRVFTRFYDYLEKSNIEVRGYDWLISFEYFEEEGNYPKYCPPVNSSSEKRVTLKPKFKIETKRNNIEIKEKNIDLATIDIKAFIDNIITTKKETNVKKIHKNYYEPIIFSQKEFTYHFENNLIIVKIIFDNIEVSGKKTISNYRGTILIKKK